MQRLKVARREIQGGQVAVLDLIALDGTDLPSFEAGAHVDVEIAAGLIRQYSLCGDPKDLTRYRLGVLREAASRGGSQAVHDNLIEGAEVSIGLPRNLFQLHAGQGSTMLIGGGIGITPLLAMAHVLHREGRLFELHYCIRSRDTAAFIDELAEIGFANCVHLHCDDEPSTRLDPARDLPMPSSQVEVHFCGPAGFMSWLETACLAAGHADTQLHKEFFSVDVDLSGNSFQVELARSGKTVTVADDQTIVQALSKAGIKVETMCQQGICGTCLCTVLEGTPDHRDEFLSDEEREANTDMLICCSRSKSSRLVLDL